MVFLFVSTKLYVMNVSSANGEQPVLLIFCYCIGSYFLLLSKVVNIICFDWGSTVEFSRIHKSFSAPG